MKNSIKLTSTISKVYLSLIVYILYNKNYKISISTMSCIRKQKTIYVTLAALEMTTRVINRNQIGAIRTQLYPTKVKHFIFLGMHTAAAFAHKQSLLFISLNSQHKHFLLSNLIAFVFFYFSSLTVYILYNKN